jgi:hypothetical protein
MVFTIYKILIISCLIIYLYLADLLKLIEKEGFSKQDIISIANKEFSIPFNKIIIKVSAYCENGRYHYISSEKSKLGLVKIHFEKMKILSRPFNRKQKIR